MPRSWSSASATRRSTTSRTTSIRSSRWSASAAAIGDEFPDFYASAAASSISRRSWCTAPRSSASMSAWKTAASARPAASTRRSKLQDKLPPPGTRFAYRWIVPQAGERTVDHFLYLDGDLKELGSSDQPTAYDPRTRLWYRSAVEARAEVISDPDVFATLGPDRLHGGRTLLFRRQAAGRGGDRHDADRARRIPRRAQGQPRHRELHARPAGPGDRGLRPVEDLCQHRRQARAAAHHLARQRPAGLRLQCPPARQRRPLHLHARRQGVRREPGDHAGRLRQELAALHHHAARRLHRRVPGQQHPAGHLRPDGDGAADRRHLLPDRRGLLAAREARLQGRQDPGAGHRAAAVGELADPARSRCCPRRSTRSMPR